MRWHCALAAWAAWVAAVVARPALPRPTCVADEASLPGRGDVSRRCAAANVVSQTEEYSRFCEGAVGAPCRCCRWLRRFSDEERVASRARDRCRGASSGGEAKGGGVVAVYTVSTGGYDLSPGVLNGTFREAGVAHVFFCAGSSCDVAERLYRSGASPWAPRRLPGPFENATAEARRRRSDVAPLDDCLGRSLGGFDAFGACISRDVKVRPHLYLGKDYEASVYVDANVLVRAPIRPLLLGNNAPAGDLGFFTFDRGVRGEADYVLKYLRRKLRLRGDSAVEAALKRKIAAQVATYGADPGETAYGKVLLRRHTARACYFNERWWYELFHGVPRDQLSLLFAAFAAERDVGLTLARLNAGPGERRCRCAADDAGFQAYFAHMGPASHLGANWKGRAPGPPGRAGSSS